LKKNKTAIWASDLSSETGEGILARHFLKNFILVNKRKFFQIKTLEQSFITNNNNYLKKKIIINNSFFHKYFGPFYGIYYLWSNHDKNIFYINYLPLWNFLIFLFLPKKTIVGPITGGVYNNKVNNFSSLLRKYIFPIFYKISVFIIYRKFKGVIFSTDLLRNYIPKSRYRFTLFNFVFSHFFLKYKKKNTKKKTKRFDLIFYNRNHSAKTSIIRNSIINFLSRHYKICVVGEFYNNNNVINYGYVSRNKIYDLLERSKIALTSEENFFSLFVIDAINCNLKIISFNNIFYNTNLKKYFFFIKEKKNFFLIKNKIKKILSLNLKYDKNFKQQIYLQKKKINNFIRNTG
jgi:hypothetical protein